MSSYIESPYTIEKRRLEGIVASCLDDLNNTIDALQQQNEKIKAISDEIANEENISQLRACNSMAKAAVNYNAEINDNRKKAENIKISVKNKIKNIQTQISIGKGMDNILRKTNVILMNLNNAGDDVFKLQKIEEETDNLKSEVNSEIKYRAESSGSTQTIVRHHAAQVIGKKGVFLGNIEENKKRNFREKLSDIFEQNLAIACAMPNSERIPSLKKLCDEFNAAADYEKDLYARSHEHELENIVKKIESMNVNAKNSEEKRCVCEKRYIALCNMLSIIPDEKLLNDKSSTAHIDTLNKQMFQKYKKQKEHEYVANALAAVLKKHNIEFQNSYATENENHFNFNMENAFLEVSSTDSGILNMQITGIYSGNRQTTDDIRKSVSSAMSFCSSMKQITSELADEFGIYFDDIRTEKPTEETIVMKSDNECSSNNRKFINRQLKYDSIGG